MSAALAFGRRGLGTTAPNPCVAALVVRDDVILARAITAPGGRPHAETQALATAGDAALGATLYVTLEPCSHHGHTRPCSAAIAEAGIARVVVALGDPDPRVSGRGIAHLRQAGIAVTTDVCASEAARQHIGHVCRVVEGRPALTLKLAETADGYAAGVPGSPRLQITGAEANAWVHMQRSMHDAVMVGIGTARADDPRLTVRLPGMGARQPARTVIDTRATLEPSSRMLQGADETTVVVITAPDADPARVAVLRASGADVIAVAVDGDGLVDARAAARMLGSRGFTRVFCEGGPQLGQALRRAGLVDEFVLLTSPDRSGVPGLHALGRGSRTEVGTGDGFHLVEDRLLGRDRLRRYQKVV